MKKLNVFQRKDLKKGATNQIRREGNIPGVVYGRGESNEMIYVNGDELKAILRNMKNGLLATTLFELHEGKNTFRAIVKDIHYHAVSYAIQHIDFLAVDDKKPVNVNVPIQVVGAADCAGVKLGGFVRQVIRSLEVNCLAKDIPSEFVLDVRDLNISESKRLSDIAMPASVRPKGRMNEVAVVIAKGKAA